VEGEAVGVDAEAVEEVDAAEAEGAGAKRSQL